MVLALSYHLFLWWTDTEDVYRKVLPRMQRPSVQFSDSWLRPSQNLPPFLGAGAVHSRIRRCSHSGLQTDHSLHTSQLPSTSKGKQKEPSLGCIWQLSGDSPQGHCGSYSWISKKSPPPQKQNNISVYLLSMVSFLKRQVNNSSSIILSLLQDETNYWIWANVNYPCPQVS